MTAMPFSWHQRAFAIWEIATICISSIFFCLCKPELPRESVLVIAVSARLQQQGLHQRPRCCHTGSRTVGFLERVGQLIATAPPGKMS